MIHKFQTKWMNPWTSVFLFEFLTTWPQEMQDIHTFGNTTLNDTFKRHEVCLSVEPECLVREWMHLMQAVQCVRGTEKRTFIPTLHPHNYIHTNDMHANKTSPRMWAHMWKNKEQGQNSYLIAIRTRRPPFPSITNNTLRSITNSLKIWVFQRGSRHPQLISIPKFQYVIFKCRWVFPHCQSNH